MAGPEEKVQQTVIKQLVDIGWNANRLRWKPKWQVPKTPHDLTKRDRGQKYESCGTSDLVAFADDSGEPHALQVIFEFKAPSIDKGRSQLIRYLSGEPMVQMGFWTNGSETLAIYKSHTNDWIEVPSAALPGPGDNMTSPPQSPPTWKDLREPTSVELSAALSRLVDTVVVTDSRSVRREEQLRELLHTLLVKVESDSQAMKTGNQEQPVRFRIYGDKATMIKVTANAVREQFRDYYKRQQNRVFHRDDRGELKLTDRTLFEVVNTLGPWRVLGDDVEILAKAFQVFRTKAMKSGEGQFLTPQRIVRPAVMAMEITSGDKVIDPACGTGGFLMESLRQVRDREFPTPAETWQLVKFANENLYGIDLDPLGVKLTRAMMIAMQDGSTHVLRGDAIRRHLWKEEFARLENEIGSHEPGSIAESFTVVLTNPPFGKNLVVSAVDLKRSNYSISRTAAGVGSKKAEYVNLEIGLVYMELAHRLLQVGGRLGIVLPETYFFSHKYRWLPSWLEGRFELRGVLNIPMEAFEEFCRAKTNFYIFEKIATEESN